MSPNLNGCPTATSNSFSLFPFTWQNSANRPKIFSLKWASCTNLHPFAPPAIAKHSLSSRASLPAALVMTILKVALSLFRSVESGKLLFPISHLPGDIKHPPS